MIIYVANFRWPSLNQKHEQKNLFVLGRTVNQFLFKRWKKNNNNKSQAQLICFLLLCKENKIDNSCWRWAHDYITMSHTKEWNFVCVFDRTKKISLMINWRIVGRCRSCWFSFLSAWGQILRAWQTLTQRKWQKNAHTCTHFGGKFIASLSSCFLFFFFFSFLSSSSLLFVFTLLLFAVHVQPIVLWEIFWRLHVNDNNVFFLSLCRICCFYLVALWFYSCFNCYFCCSYIFRRFMIVVVVVVVAAVAAVVAGLGSVRKVFVKWP